MAIPTLRQPVQWPLFLAVLVVLAGPAGLRGWGQALGADGDAGLQRRFLEEAPRRWRECLAHEFSLRGVSTAVLTKDGKDYTRCKFDRKQRPGHRLAQAWLEQVEEGKHTERLDAYNPDYLIELSRRAEGQPWVLMQLAMKTSASSFDAAPSYRYGLKDSVQAVLFQVSDAKLTDLVQQPSFRVVGAKEVRRGGDRLVLVEFDNAHDVKDTPSCNVQGGTMVLDPSRSWCVREYDVRVKYTGPVGTERSDTIELRPSKEPAFPLPVKLVTTQKLFSEEAKKSYVIRFERTYDLDESNPPGEDEFRLSAFGLPEPGTVRATPRWHFWAAVGGLCAFALAFLLRVFGRRRAAI
jgi:hypothetical protein